MLSLNPILAKKLLNALAISYVSLTTGLFSILSDWKVYIHLTCNMESHRRFVSLIELIQLAQLVISRIIFPGRAWYVLSFSEPTIQN